MLLSSDHLSELSIDSTAVFPCKTSTLSLNYMLNEIQAMALVVLYKYIIFTVDEPLALAIVINYITDYSILLLLLLIIIF